MNSASTPFLKMMKLWLRSGSYEFATNRATSPIASVKWEGRDVFYRPNTGDVDLINRILLKGVRKSEYRFPKDLNPKVILDIGANIGAATLLLRHYYPQARIVAFEPEPGNFEVLRKNTEADPNVRVFQLALGKEDTTCDLILEDDAQNNGGFSLRSFGTDVKKSVSVQVKHAGEFLANLNLGEIDLIKIDTEGSESDILRALDTSTLSKTKWICGELHGVQDFALLAHLDPWFNIGMQKSWFNRLAHFQACRKDLDLNPF